MAVSPPNASSAGLRARKAAKRDTAASTLIQAIVTVCTRWIRRMAYAVYVVTGVGLGAYGIGRGLFAPDGGLAWRGGLGRWVPAALGALYLAQAAFAGFRRSRRPEVARAAL